jgi:pilus assembly protein CpaD
MTMRSLFIALPLLALAACGPVNRGVASLKTPEVVATNSAYTASFAGGRLDERALEEWLRGSRVAYGDRISVDDPVAAGSETRRAAVAGVVARFGLILAEAGPVLPGELPPGAVRVVVTRTKITAPQCPDWSRRSNPEPSASAMSNFGCGVRGNLAAMLADPADVDGTRAFAGTDGDTSARAVRTLRDKASKPPATLGSNATTTN